MYMYIYMTVLIYSCVGVFSYFVLPSNLPPTFRGASAAQLSCKRALPSNLPRTFREPSAAWARLQTLPLVPDLVLRVVSCPVRLPTN